MSKQPHKLRILLSAIAASALLAGCATAPPPEQEVILSDALPETTVVAGKWASAAEAGEVPDGWLKSYNDPQMEAVVGEALQNNLGLRTAAANVDAAAGQATIAGARLKPTVGLGGGAANEAGDGSYGVSANVSWEIDVWGRLRSLSAASEQQFLAAQATFEFARQSLAAQTAKAWYLATEAAQHRKLAEDSVAIFSRILEIVETRQAAGRVSDQDVALARADLAEAEERLRGAEGGYQAAVRSLELLLGRYPGAEMEIAEEFVPVPAVPPAGIPSDLLDRRYDLVTAEANVKAQFQNVEAAKLAKLPSFSLTAAGGLSSNSTPDSGFFNIGANFLQPVFNAGALQAQVEIETALQEAALASYGQTALGAFNEVETALTNVALLRERVGFQSSSVGDNKIAVERTRTQYDVGRVDLLSLLQVQTRELSARSALIRLQNEALAEHINLHLALGGDFE